MSILMTLWNVRKQEKKFFEFVDSLTISTIDILKTIVNEVNIHGMEGFEKS